MNHIRSGALVVAILMADNNIGFLFAPGKGKEEKRRQLDCLPFRVWETLLLLVGALQEFAVCSVSFGKMHLFNISFLLRDSCMIKFYRQAAQQRPGHKI